jgi:formylglycine-generating enzyme required for sulfatase activity/serine/threonine protein kinase
MGASAAVHPADPILQAYGLGKLDEFSSVSVSQHLEACDPCQRRVAELSSDEFLTRLQQAGAGPGTANPTWWPSAASSSEGEQRPAVPPPPPELVDQRTWEIIRELGRGGMGVVYLARNKLMGRLEVLKVVGKHLVERPGVFDRFLREIQSAARLHHANIVTAYTADQLGGSLVLAMEYVEGLDLAKLVKTKGPLPVAHACYFIHQAALGLQHAHERGMVHRDIKPANLILASAGKKPIVKVLDFGLAKVTSEGQSDSNLTREGQMLGTPDFIAPEQIRDAQSADIRADIYSLGCTLYYLLTGGPPFGRVHVWDVYEAHRSTEAAPLNLVRPEVPIELAAVVARMMAKEPRRRFQMPGEVARVLTPFFKQAASRLPPSSSEVPRAGTRVGLTEPSIAGPVPGEPATVPANPAPSVRRPSKTGADGVAWESLIEIKEDRPLIKAATLNRAEQKPALAEGPANRPPWKFLPLAAGASVLGLLVLGIIIYIKTNRGELKDDIGESKTAIKIKAREDFVEKKPKDEIKNPEPKSNRPSRPGPDLSPNPNERPSKAFVNNVPAYPESVANAIGMTMKLIPAGTFMMGSPQGEGDDDEHPLHPVRITRPFYLGAHEVTQSQYEALMGTNPSWFSANRKGYARVAGQSTIRHPVENVSWLDAVKFCNRLSEKERLAAFYRLDGEKVTVPDWNGPGYRLPTEAEWEYACRGNAVTRYSFGDDAARLGEFGWYFANSDGGTHVVGEKSSNQFGLYDMHGNVWEWCWDGHDIGYYTQSPSNDPRGVDGASCRVFRGGGWLHDPRDARSAYRDWSSPGYRYDFLGFRLARVPSVR